MFSNNRKISIRQIRRLLILDLFGVSSLLLPRLLAGMAGPDGIFCIAAGTLLGLVFVWVLGKVLNRMEGDYYTFMKAQTGQLIGDILMIFYMFFFLLLSAFVLFELTSLVRAWLLPDGSYGLICFLVLLLAAYAAFRGIEGRARIYEILFWFLMAPLILMLVLAVPGVDVNFWTPVFNTDFRSFGTGTMTVCAFFLPVFFILFLKPCCTKPEKLGRCAGRALLIAAGINGVIYLILLGTFQGKTMSVLERPVITLMSMVNLPGGFLERMDAFMTAIWFFSLFALMNTGVFYSSHILKGLFSQKNTNYGLFAVLIIVFFAARWFFEYPGSLEIFETYVKYLALPVMTILPLILLCLAALRGRSPKSKIAEQEEHK